LQAPQNISGHILNADCAGVQFGMVRPILGFPADDWVNPVFAEKEDGHIKWLSCRWIVARVHAITPKPQSRPIAQPIAAAASAVEA
jgi:hypothetical protein